jgi:hypothetical protein
MRKAAALLRKIVKDPFPASGGYPVIRGTEGKGNSLKLQNNPESCSRIFRSCRISGPASAG